MWVKMIPVSNATAFDSAGNPIAWTFISEYGQQIEMPFGYKIVSTNLLQEKDEAKLVIVLEPYLSWWWWLFLVLVSFVVFVYAKYRWHI